MKKIIINAFGKDKPGIVSKISGIINSFNGNIETSKMIQLETDFTALLLVEISERDINNLSASLDKIKDLNVVVKKTEKKTDCKNSSRYSFSINVTDNEGIIYLFSDLFKQYDINIISMDTYLKNAPITGSPIFYLKSEIMINNKIILDDLKADLIKIANKNGIEFKLKLIKTI